MTTSDSEAFESADEDFIDTDTKNVTISKGSVKIDDAKLCVKSNENSDRKVEKNSVVTSDDNENDGVDKKQRKKERPKRQQVEKKPKQATKLGVKVASKQSEDSAPAISGPSNVSAISNNPQVEKKAKPEDDDDQSDEDWKNFDFDEPKSETPTENAQCSKKLEEPKKKDPLEDEGWDDGFDDWGDEEDSKKIELENQASASCSGTHTEKEFKELADRLSSLGSGMGSSKAESGGGGDESGGSGWGSWGGWGASLLSSGVSQITSHVSQGFTTVSNVIESGMGAPDPEDLVRIQKAAKAKREEEMKNQNSGSETKEGSQEEGRKSSVQSPTDETKNAEDSLGVFKIGKLVSSVTKLVETTGTAVVSGGLDTLEEIGKRTMRVIQGDEAGGRVRLSTLLREARDRAEERPSSLATDSKTQGNKAPRFEALFDDYQGLVHLEALEMLSKQCDMKIQTLLSNTKGIELTELRETLNQVKEICELPDPDDEEDECEHKLDVASFKSKLSDATKDLGVQLSFESIIKCWEDILKETNQTNEETAQGDGDTNTKTEDKVEELSHTAIKNLAHCSALSVQLLHKATALLHIRERRSTADEADGLTQLTTVLCSHIGEVAEVYSHKLNQMAQGSDNTAKTNTYITNVFFEAGKGSSYVRDAFQLTIPILQVGAT